jgi:hypothetical protein
MALAIFSWVLIDNCTLQLIAPRRFCLDKGGFLAECEHLSRRGGRKHVHDSGDDVRPAGLMAGPQPRAVIAVEILVRQDEITPVRVLLKFSRPSVDGAPALVVPEKDSNHAARCGQSHRCYPAPGNHPQRRCDHSGLCD